MHNISDITLHRFFIKTTLTEFGNTSTGTDPDGFRWYMYAGVSELFFYTILTILGQKENRSREYALRVSNDFNVFL